MTILIFNTFYYPKFIGGAEISVQLLAEGLVKEGHKVFVVTFGLKKSINNVNGVVVVRIKQKNVFSNYTDNKQFGALKIIWHFIDSFNPLYHSNISRLINKINPDVVHTNNIQGFSPYIWKITKNKGIPVVHTLRDYYLLCHRNILFNNNEVCEKLCISCKLTHSIKKRFVNLPDKYVGISRFILDKHNEYFSAAKLKSNVIHNAVNIPGLIPVQKINNVIVFGYIGRIAEDKGVGYLVNEIVKIGKGLKSQFKIVFAGRGEERYIMELKKKLEGLDFFFAGVVKPVDFYKNIDVLIVPSLWYEPFGRVVIESLSYSVPVCIADMGGLNELHQPNSTWLFKPINNQLYSIVKYIISNKDEITQKKAFCLEHASQFSSKMYIHNYLDIYSSVQENIINN